MLQNPASNRRFGFAWVFFAIALALHVADEATHNFLSVYNPSVEAIRARFPFLPLPTFTFGVWLFLLICAIALLLALSPLAFRGDNVSRILSRPIAILFGLFNAGPHTGSSIYFHRLIPGVYSSPILSVSAVCLLVVAHPRCRFFARESLA